MKYEVSIKSTYVPDWGVVEAFREFVANSKDAEKEMYAKSVVKYYPKSGTVNIETQDVELPREALLFGHTTKLGKAELIGQFGEGLKLACLAAVRAGHQVKIRSGSEVWTPSIVESKVFPGTEVLGFDISTGRQDYRRVAVELLNVTQELWEKLQTMFLEFEQLEETQFVETCYGKLILKPELAGQIYVKGVLVERSSRHKFSYDLSNVKVDRDRRLVDRWDCDWTIRSIWFDAVRRQPDLLDKLWAGLEEQAQDFSTIDQYSVQSLDDGVVDAMTKQFIEKHGKDAVPVLNLGEAESLSHLGRKGVVVPKGLQAILAKKIGSVEAVKMRLLNEVTRTWSWSELEPTEQSNLSWAVTLLGKVRKFGLADMNVVSFRDENLLGQVKAGMVLVAQKNLAKGPVETLRVLVHEVAHRMGGDGEKSHVSEIEQIWMDLMTEMLTSPVPL